MKKILLTIAAIALFAVPASAQMLSIWGDVEMTTCEYYGDAYVPFQIYLILEPGPDGVFAAEYMLVLPSNLMVQVQTPSPAISIVKDNPIGPPGVSVGFLTCQMEPLVVYQFQMFPTSADPSHIQIVENADTGKLIIANCEEPLRPEMPCAVFDYFGFNAGCIVGTEESSWGAIKSMMN